MTKITLLCIALMYLSNTDAYFYNHVVGALNYLNPLASAHSTALRGLGDEQHHSEIKDMNYGNVQLEIDDIRDDFSLQQTIYQVRLNAVKRFIETRSAFLKYTEDNHWEVNKILAEAKRKDLEVAKGDEKIIEEVLKNPSQFKDYILGQD